MRAADLAERCADCVASARALISATLSGLILDDCTADVDFNHAERDAGVIGASDMLGMLLVVGWGGVRRKWLKRYLVKCVGLRNFEISQRSVFDFDGTATAFLMLRAQY